MRVPIGWLREYVPIDVPVEELAARVNSSVAEVERIIRRGVSEVDGNLDLFRIGRVVEAGKHPNADRLQLCQVDVGEPEPRQIVCGAWNFGAGATVAVALPGALLPGGQRLERATLRGAASDGMILSESELELGPDHSGILVLDEGPEPGTPLAEVLPLADDVLELETTPNRPDLLAVYGVAREVAALYGLELAPPPGRDPERAGDEPVDVEVEDVEGCPRYVGRLFRGVSVAASPPWLKARLVAAGMRPISNVVDVTNYVMHALGNPLHAFDVDRLGGRKVVVRRARDGEELRTLDGTLRRLDKRDLVIADAERAVALAGIMGGEHSEVRDDTTDVLLEAANFEPVTILKSSERLGLRTDGSNRWEKGVDPYLAGQAATLATELLVELTGARWMGEVDVRGELPERPVVQLRPERTNALVGLDIPPGDQRERLERLGFDVPADWRVVVPTWRARDVRREADLVEEIARFHLDQVPFTLPARRDAFGRLTQAQRLRRQVEDVLSGCGFSEAYTSSLVASDPNPDAIRLPIPLTAEQAVLRTTLLPGLAAAVRRNLELGNEDVALFEIARVYHPSGEKRPTERVHVTGVAEGGFETAKGAVETLFRALRIEGRFERADGRRTAVTLGGSVSELDDGFGAFELDLGELVVHLPGVARYEDVITFPAVKQDLAFTVDEDVPAGALVEAAHEAAGPELRELRVFDVYRGEQTGPGKKSLAFRAVFQSPARTLSDEDAASLRARIVEALAERFGAELRA
jgi:phenylalanyl-tRNA synthetase beta chain